MPLFVEMLALAFVTSTATMVLGPFWDGPVSDSTSLGFTAQGEPFLSHTKTQPDGTPLCTDLDGQPLDIDESDSRSTAVGLIYDSLPEADSQLAWSQRITQFPIYERNLPRSFWYLMHDFRADGDSYLVGYSWGTNQRIGFIGKAGFRHEPLPHEEWFAAKGHQSWQTVERKANDYRPLPIPSC